MFHSRISAAFLIFLWVDGLALDRGDVGRWHVKASTITRVLVQMNYFYFFAQHSSHISLASF